ncbi:DEAD-box ATP-dependent RNA helicase 37-like protein [Tanacetum coccineum]
MLRQFSDPFVAAAPVFYHETGVKVLRSFERGVDILVATLRRLANIIKRSKFSLKKIKYLSLDEADRMLDMGFEPHIRKIAECMDMPPLVLDKRCFLVPPFNLKFKLVPLSLSNTELK